MSARHLGPALAAGGLFLAAAVGFTAYARAVERGAVHDLAPAWFHQKSLGNALQREAFRRDDLLPVFGTSELVSGGPLNADTMFATYPTGFEVFRVGWSGFMPLVTTAAQLVGDAPVLRGRKVVISVSPMLFWLPWDAKLATYYAGNFSLLHAYEVAFSTRLSRPLQQRLAGRLLAFPATLSSDPVLRSALELLARDDPPGRAAWAALCPLGMLRLAALRLEDHWESVAWIRSHPPEKPGKPREAREIHWPEVIDRASRAYEKRSSGNPFGVDDDWWKKNGAKVMALRGHHPDKEVSADMSASPEWDDLDLVLSVLDELGARPLLISAPMKGAYYDFLGVTPGVRKTFYYDRLRAIAAAHRVPVRCFEDHDGDDRFTMDTGDHPSPRGWAFYDQALDEFAHDTLR
jgi:D-alanine transfer protein